MKADFVVQFDEPPYLKMDPISTQNHILGDVQMIDLNAIIPIE